MAERRMFSRRIIESARFLRMPISAQALYFHLGMQADDDGIVEAFKVLRMIGANEDDLRILVGKGFAVILNEDLVTYLPDWTEHNHLRADRKVESPYRGLLFQIVPEAKLIEGKKKEDGKKKDNTWNSTDNGLQQDGHVTDVGQAFDGHMTDTGQRMDGIGIGIVEDRIGKESIEIPSAADEPQQGAKTAYEIPLKGGNQYIVTENDAKLYEQLYPGIDVAQEFRSMVGWLNANPSRQKTQRGIKRFINGWLQRSKEQAGARIKRQTQGGRVEMLQRWLEESDEEE